MNILLLLLLLLYTINYYDNPQNPPAGNRGEYILRKTQKLIPPISGGHHFINKHAYFLLNCIILYKIYVSKNRLKKITLNYFNKIN